MFVARFGRPSSLRSESDGTEYGGECLHRATATATNKNANTVMKSCPQRSRPYVETHFSPITRQALRLS